MKHDFLEFSFWQPTAHSAVVLDEVGQRAALAVLVLNVDVSVLDPRVVVPDDVLVLHQGRVGEDFVHGYAFLVSVAVDLIACHLETKTKTN
jgi:hypothetical protein